MFFSTPLYRLLYYFGVSNVVDARYLTPKANGKLDVTNIIDPTDDVYNSTIGSISPVYIRNKDNQPVYKGSIDKVTEVSWYV